MQRLSCSWPITVRHIDRYARICLFCNVITGKELKVKLAEKYLISIKSGNVTAYYHHKLWYFRSAVQNGWCLPLEKMSKKINCPDTFYKLNWAMKS
jgi:hypothetical protein